MNLGEQIAVLDGLSTIDPSGGANYSGGSSAAPRMPLLPSSIGLADARVNVIDPSEGANYSGGSDWGPYMPLTPSNAGLAAADSDLLQASYRADVKRAAAANTSSRRNVIDPSGGANLLGGSTYPDTGGLPLLPSTVGLSGFAGWPLTDKITQMSALELQQLLQWGGIPITANGVWDTKSVNAVSDYAVAYARSKGWKTGDLAEQIKPALSRYIQVYANGRQLLVVTQKLADALHFAGKEKGLEGLSGLSGLSGLGVIDPSGGVNYGGGSNYPDSGRWPLLPSTAGLAGLAEASKKFLAKKGVAVKKKPTTGNVVADAKGKLTSMIASLKAIVANPKRSTADRQNAATLIAAMTKAWNTRMTQAAVPTPSMAANPYRTASAASYAQVSDIRSYPRGL